MTERDRACRHHRQRRASAARGMTRRMRSSTPCVEGRSAIAPDHAVGHHGLAASRRRRRSPTSIRARWSTTASCTSSSAAPTCSASMRRGRAIERRGHRRASRHARRRRCRDVQRPHRRLRRLGRRQLREPVRLLPADDRGGRRPACASAASSPNTVNPMWLLRTLPNNVLGHIGIKLRPQGHRTRASPTTASAACSR